MVAEPKDKNAFTALIVESREKLLFTAACIAFLLIRKEFPSAFPSDPISLGLYLFAVLPWASSLVKSAEIGGWKIEFRELKEKVARQQALINNLVRYSMSASIFNHLCGITLLKEYRYVDNTANQREFYFLRDNGLIRPRTGGAFLDFGASLDSHNLVEIADVTPIGLMAVRLRQTDIPSNMLAESKNLRITLQDLQLEDDAKQASKMRAP